MSHKLHLAVILAALAAACLNPAFAIAAEHRNQSVNVIPLPVSVELSDGVFIITPSTRVIAKADTQAEAAKLIDALAGPMGFSLQCSANPQGREKTIELALDRRPSALADEGYTLEVTEQRILIRARRPAGLFYGIQTLLQLLPPSIFSKTKVDNLSWQVPCIKITDYPRFKWRGLLVDPARHFIPMPDLLCFIDNMALHKLNRLQVHFTDNEGWRIEINDYPKLTPIGSNMDRSRRKTNDGRYVGGFYTQDDIRRIVRYAADRHITIVPEIEMPFHTGAAIVAYPELGINTGHLAELPPEQRWGRTKGLIAPCPETVAFLQNVLSEVIELFPGRQIHIGGDEADTGHWARDGEMQAQMKQLKLKDAHELHSWFIRQMDTFLTNKGRRLVGWDEILQGGLAPGATVMSWRGEQGGITAANAGHDVVMAPTSHTYFDYYQGPKESEPRAIGGFIPLSRVYEYDPLPKQIQPQNVKHVLGIQAQLWGEYISTAAHRDYMAYPRALALAEIAWSQKEAKNYERFIAALSHHLKRLDAKGINYRKTKSP